MMSARRTTRTSGGGDSAEHNNDLPDDRIPLQPFEYVEMLEEGTHDMDNFRLVLPEPSAIPTSPGSTFGFPTPTPSDIATFEAAETDDPDSEPADADAGADAPSTEVSESADASGVDGDGDGPHDGGSGMETETETETADGGADGPDTGDDGSDGASEISNLLDTASIADSDSSDAASDDTDAYANADTDAGAEGADVNGLDGDAADGDVENGAAGGNQLHQAAERNGGDDEATGTQGDEYDNAYDGEMVVDEGLMVAPADADAVQRLVELLADADWRRNAQGGPFIAGPGGTLRFLRLVERDEGLEATRLYNTYKPYLKTQLEQMQ